MNETQRNDVIELMNENERIKKDLADANAILDKAYAANAGFISLLEDLVARIRHVLASCPNTRVEHLEAMAEQIIEALPG